MPTYTLVVLGQPRRCNRRGGRHLQQRLQRRLSGRPACARQHRAASRCIVNCFLLVLSSPVLHPVASAASCCIPLCRQLLPACLLSPCVATHCVVSGFLPVLTQKPPPQKKKITAAQQRLFRRLHFAVLRTQRRPGAAPPVNGLAGGAGGAAAARRSNGVGLIVRGRPGSGAADVAAGARAEVQHCCWQTVRHTDRPNRRWSTRAEVQRAVTDRQSDTHFDRTGAGAAAATCRGMPALQASS
jgi:hypothetical protein